MMTAQPIPIRGECAALLRLARREMRHGDTTAVDAVNERLEAARLQIVVHENKLYVRNLGVNDDTDTD